MFLVLPGTIFAEGGDAIGLANWATSSARKITDGSRSSRITERLESYSSPSLRLGYITRAHCHYDGRLPEV